MKMFSALIWWLALVFVVFGLPHLFMTAVLVLLLGAPFVSWMLHKRESLDSTISNGFTKYSVFMTETRLVITKAAIYSGMITPSNITKRG